MSILASRYGFTRPAAIAAKVERFRSLLPVAPVMVAATPTSPRCLCCKAVVAFFLCDESGKPLPRHSGGFCAKCAPLQPQDEETPEIGTPAPLEAVESLCRAFDAAQRDRAQHALLIESFQVERETLRRDLAKLQAAEYDGAGYGVNLTEEIEAIESRLETLGDYLVFEPETPFIFGFDDLSAAQMQTLVLA
jgi:hypothetical protein